MNSSMGVVVLLIVVGQQWMDLNKTSFGCTCTCMYVCLVSRAVLACRCVYYCICAPGGLIWYRHLGHHKAQSCFGGKKFLENKKKRGTNAKLNAYLSYSIYMANNDQRNSISRQVKVFVRIFLLLLFLLLLFHSKRLMAKDNNNNENKKQQQ